MDMVYVYILYTYQMHFRFFPVYFQFVSIFPRLVQMVSDLLESNGIAGIVFVIFELNAIKGKHVV